jgi:hypothetical protein
LSGSSAIAGFGTIRLKLLKIGALIAYQRAAREDRFMVVPQ